MSKFKAIFGIVLGLLLIGGVVAVIAPTRDEAMRAPMAASAQQNDRRWLAVAPGRVEPPSGIIKVATSTIGVVSKVLVKVNDTVFAGEPMILLNDDEIQARYAATRSAPRCEGGFATSSRPARAVSAATPRTRWPTRRPR